MSSVFGAHVPGIQLDMASLDAALGLAGLSEGETYAELGSGVGKGLVRAATKFGAISRGVELMPHAVDATNKRAKRAGVESQVHVTHGDLMQFDTSEADVVLAFLGSAFYDLLAPKLERELSPSARVITMGWQMHGWELAGHREDVPVQAFLYRPNEPRIEVEVPEAQPRTLRVQLTPVTRGALRGTEQWISG